MRPEMPCERSCGGGNVATRGGSIRDALEFLVNQQTYEFDKSTFGGS